MLCTIFKALVAIILCGLAIWFACRNFVGGFAKAIVSLVLCALALVLVAFLYAAIKTIGWFVFAAVCLFLAGGLIKMIKG